MGGVAAAAQMRPRRFRRCTKRGSSLWDGSVTTIEWDYNHDMSGWWFEPTPLRNDGLRQLDDFYVYGYGYGCTKCTLK
jgi:hypothetical protein